MIVYYSPTDSVLIQTGKDALFRKMPLQQRVLKMPMDMYLLRSFVLEMNAEAQEISIKLKINILTELP